MPVRTQAHLLRRKRDLRDGLGELLSRGAGENYTPMPGHLASAARVESPLRTDARQAEGRGVTRVRSEVLQAQEASRTQPETPAEARQAERGRLSSGEKRKTEGRDRAAAPRPAATPPAVRHGNGLNAIWQTKCTQQSYGAFNLPLVAFSLSGDPFRNINRSLP